MEKPTCKFEPEEILDDAFRSFPELDLPASFTDDLVKIIENRMAWRTLLMEFGLKMAIVTGSVGVVLAALFLLLSKDAGSWVTWLTMHGPVVVSSLLLLFCTFLFDQVFLRYFLNRS